LQDSTDCNFEINKRLQDPFIRPETALGLSSGSPKSQPELGVIHGNAFDLPLNYGEKETPKLFGEDLFIDANDGVDLNRLCVYLLKQNK
jgi:hypothetical protein